MKKETTIIATVEITKVIKNFSYENKTLKEAKQDIKNSLTNHIKSDNWFNVDDVNVCDVKIFELEKKERISTENLIKQAKICTETYIGADCNNCPFDNSFKPCKDIIVKALADRLEELHKKEIKGYDD